MPGPPPRERLCCSPTRSTVRADVISKLVRTGDPRVWFVGTVNMLPSSAPELHGGLYWRLRVGCGRWRRGRATASLLGGMYRGAPRRFRTRDDAAMI